MRLVGVEEHFVTDDVLAAWQRLEPRWRDLALMASTQGETARRLIEGDDERFAAMDEIGLDVAVLSLTTPGLQNLDRADALALQGATNDALAERVRGRPDRLQGLAALATQAPESAAQELERAVTRLGLDGAILFGRTRERNLDDPDYWPIFEAAEALRAPVLLHPQSPLADVRSAYYSGFGDPDDSALATFGIGWHYETGMQLVRMLLRGVFDRFPGLQVIAGHWGEVVLFYLERIAKTPAAARLQRPLIEYFRHNVSITPSGMFSPRYLRWATELVGPDRVVFSTDYPFERSPGHSGRRFLEEAALDGADRTAIASTTWDRLSAGIRR